MDVELCIHLVIPAAVMLISHSDSSKTGSRKQKIYLEFFFFFLLESFQGSTVHISSS